VEETSVHRSPPIKVCCEAFPGFLVEPFSVTIAYVDPNIAGKRVGENNTQLFTWHWPGDNESRLPIVTSICQGTYAFVRPRRHTYGKCRIRLQTWMRVTVDVDI